MSISTINDHAYHGSVKLSFCTDSASSVAAIEIATVYFAVENGSTRLHSRSTQAQATIETVKAMLPSTVFADVAAHRVRPNRRPAIEAFTDISMIQSL